MHIKIFDKTFKINFTKDRRDFSDSELIGQTKHHEQILSVLSTDEMHDDSQKETLFHEVIHAVDKQINGNELTEKQVAVLSVGLLTVIKGNPRVFSYIFGWCESPEDNEDSRTATTTRL